MTLRHYVDSTRAVQCAWAGNPALYCMHAGRTGSTASCMTEKCLRSF